jgi:hypothetical protein
MGRAESIAAQQVPIRAKLGERNDSRLAVKRLGDFKKIEVLPINQTRKLPDPYTKRSGNVCFRELRGLKNGISQDG